MAFFSSPQDLKTCRALLLEEHCKLFDQIGEFVKSEFDQVEKDDKNVENSVKEGVKKVSEKKKDNANDYVLTCKSNQDRNHLIVRLRVVFNARRLKMIALGHEVPLFDEVAKSATDYRKILFSRKGIIHVLALFSELKLDASLAILSKEVDEEANKGCYGLCMEIKRNLSATAAPVEKKVEINEKGYIVAAPNPHVRNLFLQHMQVVLNSNFNFAEEGKPTAIEELISPLGETGLIILNEAKAYVLNLINQVELAKETRHANLFDSLSLAPSKKFTSSL